MKANDNKKKRFLLHRAKKMERIRMLFKKHKKEANRRRNSDNGRQYPSISEYAPRSKKTSDRYDITIKVPKVFSLMKEPETAVSFISKVEKALNNGQTTYIDMSNVEVLADGALVVLLSSMIKFKSNNIKFNGNFPDDEKVRASLVRSGFFDQLYGTHGIKEQDSYSFTQNRIFTHANKIVDSRLSSEIIKSMSRLIWKEDRRCPGVQRAFLELMQNTNNHADKNKNGVHHWWTTVSYNQEENKACFSFIDYGIGITQSIYNDDRSRLHKVLDFIQRTFNPQHDADLLELLLKGKIHSSTGMYYRGKGLPGIFAANRDNKLSNLVVISNKAKADVSKNLYIQLDKDFSGTFVYWELSDKNESIKNI